MLVMPPMLTGIGPYFKFPMEYGIWPMRLDDTAWKSSSFVSWPMFIGSWLGRKGFQDRSSRVILVMLDTNSGKAVPFSKLEMRLRCSRFRKFMKLTGISPEKLLNERSKIFSLTKCGGKSGSVPTKRLSERLRETRFEQLEIERGSTRPPKVGIRHKSDGKGPEMLKPVKFMEMTFLVRGSHEMPVQLHAVKLTTRDLELGLHDVEQDFGQVV
ncbi:DegPprotease 7 [Striga asiatica]|uniref:DegPprotease 7 n=1 Tax=Striga asiatica TaxID=4170 RepID=A0A5A7Q385_STRAF|nr:DegPprotease 7 [Striga asiatica]